MKQGQVIRKFESFGFSSLNPSDPNAEKELVLHISNQVQKGNDFKIKIKSTKQLSQIQQILDYFIKIKSSLKNEDLEDYGIQNHVTLKLLARKQGQQLYFINSIHNILEESKKTQEQFQNAKWAVEGAFMK
ncbi:unnamed protein product [Paramecium primaurelia]|uniref:Uncharacterized protein n=1 Tax=Paramecium primaurelia TaxID=5886 RepID=A0A8S1KU06_PARPR|nr:unnamed protein product [Paramecium primaurelia]